MEVKKWFKLFKALSLVPSNKVTDGFVYLMDNAPEIDIDLNRFLEYFTETWLEGNVDIIQWNHYENDGPRTNNHVEAYNLKVQKHLKCSHPNIWLFISFLQKEETSSYLKFLRLEKGILKEKGRNKANIDRDLKLMIQKNKFLRRELNFEEYLNSSVLAIQDF